MKTWSNLAAIVMKRTYSRKDGGTLENWKDILERAIEGNVRGHNVPEQEIKDLLRLGMERKAIPAGRGLWFSGSPSHKKIGGAALVNCWGIECSNWENFILIADLLMLGGGVGASVEWKYISKLPKIKKDVKIAHENTKDADFIVPDSRTGWCGLVGRVLESYFVTGKSFSYSTVCVRGYGERIRGFGGTASGPLPLIRFVQNISTILDARSGKSVRPIDASDIVTSIGEMVVSGNVRRSAILILGDCWDKDYLRAKRWDLDVIPSYRSCANYSVVCDDTDDLHPLYWKTFESGEAFGLVNRSTIRRYGRLGEIKKDTAYLVNPCQPSWATVLTPEGIRQFKDIDVGSLVFSGKRFTKVTEKIYTGEKPVFGYNTRGGFFVGTENHRVISEGERKEVQYAESIDTCVKMDSRDLGWISDPQAVMDGLVIGDGSVHKASNNKIFLTIGKDDDCYFDSEVRDLIGRHRPGVNPRYWEITTTLSPSDVPKTYDRRVPEKYKFGTSDKAAYFLRGLYSANGSVVDNRVTLKATSLELIRDVQEMLSSLGIMSYYTVNKSQEVEFDNGTYLCRESYDLNTSNRGRFNRVIGFIHPYKSEKLLEEIRLRPEREKKTTFPIVETHSFGVHSVWDIAVEDEEHTYWTGGLLVSNCGEATLEHAEPCNLGEIALPNLRDEEEFILSARLMHRYGKRVTMEKYHHEEIQEVIKRNRRIGTGITGCLASPLFNTATLDRVYGEIQRENVRYSKQLGIPESIRTTVIKPSGTVSKVLDMDGYEGIHPAYSRYIIQRVRFASNDPLIPHLRDAGHHIEPVRKLDGTTDHGTLVVDFYVEAPKGYPVADEDWDMEKQLETVLLAQKHWADQSVSVSVYYKREEVSQVKKWLTNNLENIKTISFLAHSDHGFAQAPKEKITADQYERLSKRIKPVPIDKITDEGVVDVENCEGGVCPVK
jgi:ribonucleotide reductase alpha subunit